MREIRLYLGELDSEFITIQVNEEQFELLKAAQKINIDDGGYWFTELILNYRI